MDTKSINIDPQLFEMSGNKKSKSRKNTSTNKNVNIPIKNTDIYNLITSRLKNKKKQEVANDTHNPLKQSSDPIINIKNDIEYVQNMLDEAKNKKKSHNKTKKAFSYSVDNEIPWGNMKNGQKQCFREWKRTSSLCDANNNSPKRDSTIQFLQQDIQPNIQPMKQSIIQDESNSQIIASSHNIQVHPTPNPTPSPTLVPSNINETIIQSVPPSINHIKDIQHSNPPIQPIPSIPPSYNTNSQIQQLLPSQKVPIKINKKIKKTIHNKYNLGKSKHKNNTRVGILLKNPSTRKNIIDECKKLKTEDITEIKSYLRKRGFIREGSIAPSNVIRELYCSLKTSGDIQNKNKEYTIDDLHLIDDK